MYDDSYMVSTGGNDKSILVWETEWSKKKQSELEEEENHEQENAEEDLWRPWFQWEIGRNQQISKDLNNLHLKHFSAFHGVQ